MSALGAVSWSLCGAALVAARLGWTSGAWIAATLSLIHGAVLAALSGRRASVAIQLRVLFAAVATLGAVPGLSALHGIQIAGTALRLGSGYCLGGRLLLLLPWNRTRPLSLDVAWRALRPGPPGDGPVAFDGPVRAAARAARRGVEGVS